MPVLCTDPSRLENLPDRRMLLRMGRAMVGLYCAAFAQVPRRITLDIDDWAGARFLETAPSATFPRNGE
ncbi:hypothetical protein CNY89_15215 [Amaricoccus sp. HAR-UPW-R2A-40]|nr:hypothetical protein CNY89_15215 [Amaricoccus sp. HAR-UPW-R2A-40]